MKVAFLFSGQLRSIDFELFKKSLDNLTSGLDYSIFSYSWEEMGKSLNHGKELCKLKKIENIDAYLKFTFQNFNLCNYGYEKFKEFDLKLEDKYKKILRSKTYHFGTINVLPQIFTLYKCYELMENSEQDFDLIFRCRFDSLFIHPLNICPLEKIYSSNFLYNLNFGRAYYPKRVYDIFFGGSKKSMNFISSIWPNVPSLVQNEFDNGLDKRDCCRLLFLAAKNNNIQVKSFNTRICDVFRNNGFSYEKYLISSHLFQPNKKWKLYLESVFKWFNYRRFSKYSLIFYLLKFFLLIPFSYIKRLRYIFRIL